MTTGPDPVVVAALVRVAQGMVDEVSGLRARWRYVVRIHGTSARDAALVALRDRGYTLEQIGDGLGHAREYVRTREKRARARAAEVATSDEDVDAVDVRALQGKVG